MPPTPHEEVMRRMMAEAASTPQPAPAEAAIAAAPGPPTPKAPTSMFGIPKLRLSGQQQSPKGGASSSSNPNSGRPIELEQKNSARAAQAALAVMEDRCKSLEVELATTQSAGLRAYAEAEQAEAAAMSAQRELEEVKEELSRSRAETPRVAKEAAEAAKAEAVREVGATEASLRKELEDARRAVSLERDKLEATQEAVRCLEAIAAASATENEAAREEQIRESAANQSRLEAALKRSEEGKVEKEEACNAAIKRADGAKEEVLSLTAELERERIISRQRAEEMEVMARRLAASEAAAASGSSGQGSRGGGDAEVEGKLTAAIQALERSSARSLLSSASAMSTLLKQASAAAPGLSEKVSTTASSLADKWFVEGRTANENGDASKACELFSQAFIVCPRPSLLLSIANMRLKLDEPLAAIELYRIVLPEAPIPSDVPDVVDAAAPAVDVGDVMVRRRIARGAVNYCSRQQRRRWRWHCGRNQRHRRPPHHQAA